MVLILDIFLSKSFLIPFFIVLVIWIFLYIQWKNYFNGLKEVTLITQNFYSSISSGLTIVSILFPSTVALLIYYLKSTTEDWASVKPLLSALVFFLFSVVIGVYTAFSLATQTTDNKIKITQQYKSPPLFLAVQLLVLLSGIFLVTIFFLTIDAEKLRKSMPEQNSITSPTSSPLPTDIYKKNN